MVRSLALLFTLLALALPTHAQEMGAEPLTMVINPSYPRPYQTVRVTPASTLIDLYSSTVTVSANGVVVRKGTGAEPVNVPMGGPGVPITITVSALNNGKTYTKQMTIRPADVALVVEPATSAHPFYQGGTPVASEGRLRLVAMPDLRSGGARISPATLVYTWRLGDQILEAQSGIGKSVLVANAPVRYRDTAVTVTVSTQDSAVVAQTSAIVAPIDPVIRIYQNDPLLGPLFDHVLTGNKALEGEEETFRAIPYFFPLTPEITWLVNNAPSGADKDITLRSSGNGGGTAALSVTAKHTESHASATARMTLEFGKAGGIGIFGL